MRSLGGLPQPEVPCAVCHERIPGLAWGERCAECLTKRRRRARRLARRISLVAALLAAAGLGLRASPGVDARLWIGIGTLATFLLARVIAYRIAMEFLPD